MRSATVLRFQKETVNQFNNIIKASTPASLNATRKAAVTPNKWQPTHGNSFRSFAEYRLKATNVSPLALKFKKAN